MSPIDPAQSASPNPRSPMAPPYVDDNLNKTLVEQGLEVAEDERRDAVTAIYEDIAQNEDDPEESLGDIDYSHGEELANGSEVGAIREMDQQEEE